MSPVKTATQFRMKMFYCHCLFWRLGTGVGGRGCAKYVDLQVIAEKTKIYSYFCVTKNPYPERVS
jgi:hypothetical protein